MASNKLTDLINEHDTDSNSNIKPSPYDQGNSNSHNGEFGNNWFEDSFDNTTYDEPGSDSERVSKRVCLKNICLNQSHLKILFI